MAIIYSYPINTNILATDIIVGSSTVLVGGRPKNQTKSFEIQDLAAYFASVIAPPGTYVPYTGAVGSVNLGAYNLTANSVTTTIDSTISGLTIGKGSGNVGSNTVVGNSALSTNVTGTQITAIGDFALNANTANNNTAVGFKAMAANTTGNTNTSVGAESLQTNLGGNENSAFGYRALYLATSANKNNAFGRTALGNILTGNQNIGIGVNAGLLTAAGNPNTTSDLSIYIGNDTKPSLDNNQNEIVIGNVAVGAGSNTVTLGNTLITTTRLRGNVQGGAFVKDSGTASQYLMADGSVTTGPVLTGYVPYIGATGPVNLGAYDLTLNGATIGRGGGQVYSNIVFGLSSLLNNTTGQNNTYLGFSSGYYNTTGSYNSAIGAFAAQFTTTGNYNNTIGNYALFTNTTGSYNVAIGTSALFNNTVGGSNIAIGYSTLAFNTVGLQNTAIGNSAGSILTIGGSNTSGNQNIFIGDSTTSLTNSDVNQIVIGYNAAGAGSNTVVLGNSSITTTRLRGAVQGGSFVKDLGTAAEYLMADGSVTTSGPLFKAASSATATGVISVISPAIIGSLFPDGSILRIQTMVTFGPSQTLNITPIRYYINTSPSLVGATQIAIFNIVAGIRYSGVERSFWSIANTFNARNFTDSSQSSITNSTNSPGSTSIPATFYIIASMSVGVGDLGTIASILVEKI